MCASNTASVNAVDARVLNIEHDNAKNVRSYRHVKSAIVRTIKKKYNLREAQHNEDADTLLKEVTYLWSDIKSEKRTTAEAVRTINDEHTSRSFDEKRKLKSKHTKSIFYKHSFIKNVRQMVKERNVNAQDLEK